MLTDTPQWIAIAFILTSLLTIALFYKASNNNRTFLVLALVWIAVQGFVSNTGFYTITDQLPPRFLLLVLPPLFLIISLFFIPKGRAFIDQLNLKWLHIVHVVRIPVEIVLLYLFYYGKIPQAMTFEGLNFDILAGITALIVVYLGFMNKTFGRKALLVWNFAAVLLLLNIVVIAILSAPFPFQQMAFEQPNIAVLVFPFVWLPCIVVPLVLFSHLASIRQLIRNND